MEILNHREMEYETKKLFDKFDINPDDCTFGFDAKDEKAIELMNWLTKTANLIQIQDILLDYGLDCIRGYLMFEKIPKANDLDMDTWEEGSLEGVYKFICRFYRAMNTIYHANKEGKYKDRDFSKLNTSVLLCEQECLRLLHMENTLPNRHNILSALMDELNLISKECLVSQLTVKHHEEEINQAVPNAGVIKTIENGIGENEELNEICKKYMTLVSPFIPYITEQCWKLFDDKSLAIKQKWSYEKIELNTSISIPVQINGKTKFIMDVENSADEGFIRDLAVTKASKFINGKEYKIIYVDKKIINFLVK